MSVRVVPQPKTEVAVAPPRAVTPAPARRLQRACACGGTPIGGGECEACRRKKRRALQRSAAGPGVRGVPPIVERVLAAPGAPLDASTRTFMESRFGHDFGRVRVHHDEAAAESARAVQAHAYTVGQDIVFARGKYEPGSPAGRRLLAHELAHTLQQRGVQRSADGGSLEVGGPLEARLEREAEEAARAVVSEQGEPAAVGAAPRGRPPIPAAFSFLASPVVSRDAAAPAPPAGGAAEPVRDWEDVPPALKAKGVIAQSKLRPGVIDPEIRAFRLAVFQLPPEKGPVVKAWEARALAGALESIVEIDGRARSALKQERPDTGALERIWLTKVGWKDRTEATKLWLAAGGDKLDSFQAKVGGATCEFDHIVELQIGGNNTTENIQVLDRDENGTSGREIFRYLKDKAVEIREEQPKLSNVILHFDTVTQASATCRPKSCCAVEQAAVAMIKTREAAGNMVAAEDTEPYAIEAGARSTLEVPKGKLKPRKVANVPLLDAENKQNRSVSTLIPGLVLTTLHLRSQGIDTIDSHVDTTNDKTRLPITIDKNRGNVPLNVNEQTRKLSLAVKHPQIAFTYPYLSKGTITELDYDPAVGLSGKGKLRPSIPFLNRLELGVAFSPGRFEVTGGVDPKKISPPIPGAKLTKAELSLVLAPEFNPSGALEFELAPGGKKLAEAALKVEKDSDGLVATGNLRAYIPGVDEARGTVEYRNKKWSGGIRLESTQIKLPYVKSGVVVVGFNDKGLTAEGTVGLEVPGGHAAEVKLVRSGQRFVFTGKGVFKVPRLDDTTVYLTYDGEHLVGSGKTGFTFQGLRGRVEIAYAAKAGSTASRISGKGEIDVDKGRAKGKLTVVLNPSGKFSGEGSITYQVSENLIASAGILLDEHEKVTLKGALELPKPIPLFQGLKGDRELFRTGITIPIPGASIGPIGLVIKIDGSLGARYGIGPGELRNTRIAATFNPLETKPDLDLELGSLLYIGAYAGVYGKVRGAIAIDAKIASLSGGLTVTASADLDGKVEAAVKLRYQKNRFEVTAEPAIGAGLTLGLKLDADILAEAGIGPFSVETRKTWHLKDFRYDTGLRFGMKTKIYYASDQPFKAPGYDDIVFERPQLGVGDMLERVLKGGKQEPPS